MAGESGNLSGFPMRTVTGFPDESSSSRVAITVPTSVSFKVSLLLLRVYLLSQTNCYSRVRSELPTYIFRIYA